jgi:energy-coupling factor transporter transmembrane protein EcfT
MKRVLLMLGAMVLLLFSSFSAIAASAYVLGGKQAFMDFLQKIPDGRFVFIGIPMFLVTFGSCCYLFFMVFQYGLSPEKPKKKIYYLRDDSGKTNKVFDSEGNEVEFLDLGKKDQI